jgi:hypothetical protein
MLDRFSLGLAMLATCSAAALAQGSTVTVSTTIGKPVYLRHFFNCNMNPIEMWARGQVNGTVRVENTPIRSATKTMCLT